MANDKQGKEHVVKVTLLNVMVNYEVISEVVMVHKRNDSYQIGEENFINVKKVNVLN